MGQVPLLIGNGRLARHLAHWLALEGIEHRRWSRAEARVSGLTLSAAASDASMSLLAVSDGAIAGLVAELRAEHPRKPVFHFSGALSLAGAAALHPLMTFGPELYPLETYRAISFVCDPGRSPRELGLPNSAYDLDPAARPYYHALCVMAGNFPQILWRRAWEALPAELGVPPQALAPFLRQSLENFLAHPAAALTGPLARGDRSTIEANLQSLAGTPLAGVYQSFVDLTAEAEIRRNV